MDAVYNYSWSSSDRNTVFKRHWIMHEKEDHGIKKWSDDIEVFQLARTVQAEARKVDPPFRPGYLPPYIEYADEHIDYFEPYDDGRGLKALEKP
jgi:hypothetical protein